MTWPTDHDAKRRKAHPTRSMAAAGAIILLTLSGCGSSKPVPKPNPSAVLDNATLADVACNDAGWNALEDYTRTILLQAALYQGHLQQGKPGGPPVGAAWLVNGLIDPAKAANNPGFQSWTEDATVQAYLKPLQDRQAMIRRDYICATSSATATPAPTLTFSDFVCHTGGSGMLTTLGWTAVENYELALVGQSALSTGWMKQGSAGGPPADVGWLSAGQLIPQSISIDSEYAAWEGKAQQADGRVGAYFTALFGYDQVVGNRICGIASAEYSREFATLPTSISEVTKS